MDITSKTIALFAVVFIIAILLIKTLFSRRRINMGDFPDVWRDILRQNVSFYNSLNEEEQIKFEKRIQEFLYETKISGVRCEIGDLEKVLVAASAVIPVFAFDDWKYDLNEVLIYDGSFNDGYQTEGDEANILGMVGEGAMHRMMILSKPALIQGFRNAKDKKNVGIHEFVHLIDKADGVIDGIPSLLLENQYSIPWLEKIREKMEDIRGNKSDINPYGATAKEEFYAVVSEYFFERPHLMKSKHPEIYEFLRKTYKNNLVTKYTRKSGKVILGRNSLCPCGSGKKYKYCCLKTSR